MSPLLTGVFASGVSGHLFSGPTGAFDALGSVTVGSGGLSSITFSAIPQTYTHLQIRANVQTNRSTYGIDEGYLTFNGDNGSSSYAYHFIYGDGSSATASASPSVSHIATGSGNFGTSTGGTFGGFVCDILDYASTNKNKTVRMLGGADLNGTVGGLGARTNLASGLWMNNTTGISSLTLTPVNSSLFTQYSNFSLYGIR